MSRSTTVQFRGCEVDVEFTDHGYEPDTGAHEIDWDFSDDELNKIDLTEAEELEIYQQLVELTYEYDED